MADSELNVSVEMQRISSKLMNLQFRVEERFIFLPLENITLLVSLEEILLNKVN